MPNENGPVASGEGRGQAFVLFGSFLAGAVAGGWLGLVATFVSGLALSDSPRFPGEDLLAVVIAGGGLFLLCNLVYRAGGRSSRNDLLFVAGFAAFVVLYSVDSAGAIPLLAPLPALLVALLFALAAVRQSPLLRLAGLVLGSLYVFVGVMLALTGVL